MNMVIYNHSRYLNIAFWGVVLGELISLAHDFHFTKGLLWKFSAAIPENLGTLISFVCGAILWMYLQQAWANHKVFKTVSISSLIAMEGLFCLFLILADKNLDWESASDGATLSLILVLFLFFAYLVLLHLMHNIQYPTFHTVIILLDVLMIVLHLLHHSMVDLHINSKIDSGL